jgi:hypothetical protein
MLYSIYRNGPICLVTLVARRILSSYSIGNIYWREAVHSIFRANISSENVNCVDYYVGEFSCLSDKHLLVCKVIKISSLTLLILCG